MRDLDPFRKDIWNPLDRPRSEGHKIDPNEELYAKWAVQSEWDPPQINFIKRLLQCELPQNVRAQIIDELFRRYVTENEQIFAHDLYLNEEQLRVMARHGMVVGSHGYEHRWMNTLLPSVQRDEIEANLQFIGSLGMSHDKLIMCYPYGEHDESLRSICTTLDYGMAFTTKVEIAELNSENALTLPQLDTNHFPKDASAAANIWTQRVLL